MKKIKVLLTGGNGFIGKNILEQRSSQYDIVAPLRKELNLLDTTAVDRFFEKNRFDVVIHGANIGGLRNQTELNNIVPDNLRMFFNIVKNVDKYGKMIQLGSGAEYDKAREIIDIKENEFEKHLPSDDYGFYKYVCSKYIENADNLYNLRLFGIFGKYENYQVKFISNLLVKYILKRPLTMIQDAYFDYVYIDDFIKILDFFIIGTPLFKSYNIGFGEKNRLLTLAKIINRLDDYSMDIVTQKSGFNKEYTCSNKRLMKELGQFKFTKIEDSIRSLWTYYKNNIDNIDCKVIIDESLDKL